MVSSLTIYETLRHAGVPDEQNNAEQSKILATKVDVEKSTRTVTYQHPWKGNRKGQGVCKGTNLRRPTRPIGTSRQRLENYNRTRSKLHVPTHSSTLN